MGYQPEECEQVLDAYAFSDATGESIMMDFLMLEDVKLLEVIEKNQSLKSRYNMWVNNLTDPANEFRYSKYIPSEVPTRKKYFLIEKLKKNDNSLAKLTWPILKEVRTSKIKLNSDLTNNERFFALTGTWEGTYDEKGRQIRI